MHSVEITLKSRDTEIVDTYFVNFEDSSREEFINASSVFTESFEYRDKMEVWVIDKNGNAVASTGGYDVTEYTNLSEYFSALKTDSNNNIRKGKMPWGERVMTMTHLLKAENREPFGAVIYIISTKDLYHQLILNIILILSAIIMLTVIITSTGFYFVSSIVNPVNKISNTAKEIATGDFTVRISENSTDDEIGELCNTINNMAYQLGENERLKNDFISTISHEIRTPLTAIKGWGETLSATNESKDELTKKGLKVIINETERLSDMVEELLDFSRIQSGGFKLSNSVVDIIAEIQQAFLVYLPKAQDNNIFLKLDYNDNEEYFVMGDTNKIYQVFINILDNAVKYTENDGFINILVENKNNYVKILFRDSGIGISDADLLHVKDKFYKGNNSKRGTGIGLAVADEVIKLHGGYLNINSKINEGTTVEVLIPKLIREDKNEK